MAFLTLHEMLPLAFDYAGQKQAVKAVFFGMAFMSARLVIHLPCRAQFNFQRYHFLCIHKELFIVFSAR